MNQTLDEPGLLRLGQELGRSLPPGQVVWLTGNLGAGKTSLARAMVEGRGCREGATSPTFALVHRYEGPGGPVFHVDCYRLRAAEEAGELDWEEMASGDLLLVEWPERAGEWVPAPDLLVHLEHTTDLDARIVTLRRERPPR